MELNPLQNVALNDVVAHAHTSIDAATMEEILCALVVPLLALIIGLRVNRYVDSKHHTTLGLRIIDFTAPLLSPLLAILFSLLSMALFNALKLEAFILPFVVKLAVSWFAIQLVMLMSSRRTAGWFIALFIIPITLLHMFGLWDATTSALDNVNFSIGSVKLNLYLILKGITVIVVLQWVASFLVRLTDNRLRRIRDMRASNRTLILKIFQILLYCFIFVTGMQMLGISLAALSVFGGALGVGLGFGLQKIASNFISGIILLFEKSIEVDDLIELADGTTGFVRQTNARFTLLETGDGKDILIPNEEFISQRVISWTHSSKKARIEIPVSIAYDADVQLARKLMIEAATSHSRRQKSIEPACHMVGFGDNGIDLKLYFWVENVTDGRLEPRSDVMIAIWEAFKTHGINVPFPQREVRIIGSEPPAGPKPLDAGDKSVTVGEATPAAASATTASAKKPAGKK